MHILIAIPHYFEPLGRPGGDGRLHGSTAKDPEPRVAALTANITALWQLYGPVQHIVDIEARAVFPANRFSAGSLDVVVCTTNGRHLLGRLGLPAESLKHYPTRIAPTLLGFECRQVLRDNLGAYDYYGYMEDDLIVRDPWMFHKLACFNGSFGNLALLQPNRYEVGPLGPLPKVYIDGPMALKATAAFQNLTERPTLAGEFLTVPIGFERARNPHAGCYFLNAEQMEYWTEQKHFLDRDTRFVGPLESAATLGIMRTFRVYKPRAENASFLEIEHFGSEFLNMIVAAGGV